MIVITGATGQLGSIITERLLARGLSADQVGVSVRDPAKADALARRGVRVRRADFADARSLAHAFEGASQVLVISANAHGDAAVHLNGTAIEAAKQAGADRVLYTSHMGASPVSAFPPMITHAASEAALQDLGIPFTSLRNGFYASTVAYYLSQALRTGELAVPEDGPVAWTTHADLGDLAAIALTAGKLDGLTPPLTGSQALDMADVAAIASELHGRDIRRVVVPDSQFRDGIIAAGLPEHVADVSLGMFTASRKGEFARIDPTLARLIDREPMQLATYLRDAPAPSW